MRVVVFIGAALLAVACVQLPEPGEVGAFDLSDIEKRGADYVSTNAREYALKGTAHAVMPEGLSEMNQDEATLVVERTVDRRLSVVSASIRHHIDSIVRQANGGTAGEKDAYFTYFRRTGYSSAADIRPNQLGETEFTFELQLVGSFYLMGLLDPNGSGNRSFVVTVANRDGSESETVSVQMTASETQDAFPRYDELFSDGVLDMGIHFGGDYNEDRFDITTAKWLVERLLSGEWTHSTVSAFEDLKIDSGPFKRTVMVEGRPVEVRVYVYHSDMVTEAEEERLSEVMKTSLAERDIVMYSGHAGDNAGFILDYQPRHEIKARDFAQLEMASKYQVFVLDGCRTYRTYVRDIMANPSKTFDNVDIVTTVNTTPFSAGFQMLHEFIYWLTITNQSGAHYPLTWKSILRGVNTRSFKSVHYGVHGIGGNPQLNPNGSEGIACTPCTTDGDCGAGGNLCLGYGAGTACGVACASDTACGPGFRCARLTEDDSLFYLPKQCVRRDYMCSGS